MSDDAEDRALNNAAEWMRHSFPNSPIFQNRTMSLKAMLMRFYDYGVADGKLAESDAKVRELEAANAWREINDATPDAVRHTADIVRPKLGQACLQSCMGYNGVRYAFLFENPGAERYVWLELPPPPAAEKE